MNDPTPTDVERAAGPVRGSGADETPPSVGGTVALAALSGGPLLGVFVVAFGDIGFDHAGRFGLDFGHFVLIAFCSTVSLIAAAGTAVALRRWWWLVGQWFVLCTFAVALIVGG